MSQVYDLAQRGLIESLAAIGETFSWNSQSYACSIDSAKHSLTTAASFFGSPPKYPKRGDKIIVAGRTVQVTKLNNSAMRAAAGGMVEDQPFVDDPSDPALDIEYDKFIKK
jgi:hypothetical protein